MALEFIHRTDRAPAARRIALFPGAWNPPTVAHQAIASAALQWADEVIWVLPAAFPHKTFEGAAFADRRHMLRLLAEAEPGFSAAVSTGGLYAEIAAEARAHLDDDIEIALVCGRDAAERIAAWDYGEPGVFERMIRQHPLLVAARAGDYQPHPAHAPHIVRLDMAPYDHVSSTELRRRIASGAAWEPLVPARIRDEVRRVYGLDC